MTGLVFMCLNFNKTSNADSADLKLISKNHKIISANPKPNIKNY